MKRLLPLLSLAPLLLVTMGAGPCDSQPLGNVDGGTTCTYQGKTYPSGASVPSNDSCNTCSCTTSGQIACTLKACTCIDGNGKSVPCAATDGGVTDGAVTDGAVTDGAVTDGAVTDVRAPDGGAREGGATDGGGVCFDTKGNSIPCPTADGGASTCDYLGKSYPVGASVPSSDGLSTCVCDSVGYIACPPRLDAGVDGATTCDYAGVRYAAGATFPSTDGCNTCSCSSNGVACTTKACFPDAGTGDGAVMTGVCKVGSNQTCNEDPVASALRGKCQPDGSCSCVGSGTSGVVSPYTGKCLGPANTTGEGCEYAGEVQRVGASFKCADGCNTCTCKAPGAIVSTDISCGQDGGTTSMCGLDAVYIYGSIGGKVAYQDQVTIAPSATSPATVATYVLTRSSNGGSSGVSCSPAFPSCGSPTALDVSDIMADILDPVVQRYLSTKSSTPVLFGLDTRPVDGPIFSFQRGDGHGFLVGAPCNGATSCAEIPPTVSKLVADLRALDQQQLQSPSCAAVVAPPKP